MERKIPEDGQRLLKDFIYKGLKTDKKREEFAVRVGTTLGQLKQMAYGNRPCKAEYAINIDRESKGKVPMSVIRPDVDWAYVGTAGRRKISRQFSVKEPEVSTGHIAPVQTTAQVGA